MQAQSSVVVMPACKRPELLALALRRLAAARNRPEVHIYADQGSRLGEIEVVRDLYLPEAFLFEAHPHVICPSGTWNILQAIRDGARFADNVYLVEEDVMVYPYFFEWHEKQSTDVSCGRILPRWPHYTNPGSRLGSRLLDALLPHINDEYFQDTVKYCERFAWQHSSTLDDGLIRRVFYQENLTIAFPETPVCAHQGFRMLDHLDIYMIGEGTLEERIRRVSHLLEAPPNQERYARDWEPFAPRTER